VANLAAAEAHRLLLPCRSRMPPASAGRAAGAGRSAPLRISRRCRRQFAAFVKVNPGLRIEQINKELGTTTKDLALPIRKLVADKVISAKSQKRSTTYFPGKKAK